MQKNQSATVYIAYSTIFMLSNLPMISHIHQIAFFPKLVWYDLPYFSYILFTGIYKTTTFKNHTIRPLDQNKIACMDLGDLFLLKRFGYVMVTGKRTISISNCHINESNVKHNEAVNMHQQKG